MSVTRIVLSTILAAGLGALSGAALLGLPTYFSNECGFLGCSRGWTPYAIIEGTILGLLPGALIGFVVSRFKVNIALGALMGAGIGLTILLLLFATGLDPFMDHEVFLVGVACIPSGGIIGLTIAIINRNARLHAAEQIVGPERRGRVL